MLRRNDADAAHLLSQLAEMCPSGLFFLLALCCAASDTHEDIWKRLVGMDKQAVRWQRTRWELSLFDTECAWLAPSWQSLHLSHDALGSVMVFDVRHGLFPGMGALQERLFALLRVARSLKRCCRPSLRPGPDPAPDWLPPASGLSAP